MYSLCQNLDIIALQSSWGLHSLLKIMIWLGQVIVCCVLYAVMQSIEQDNTINPICNVAGDGILTVKS